jgi:hypothetical protein
MFCLLIVGAIVPMAIIPFVSVLNWPPVTKLIIAAAEFGLVVYALTLLLTKLVLSEEGLYEKQLFSELKLQWNEIAEWRWVKDSWCPDFWILDNTGKKYQLKRWLVFGRNRSRQVVEIMRSRGIVGGEDSP